MKMSEPMHFQSWCKLCERNRDDKPDISNDNCFECMWRSIYRYNVKVPMPRLFVEKELNEDGSSEL